MGATSLRPHQVESLRVIHRQRDWGTPILLVIAFFLLGSAVFIFVYPWANLTYQLGTAAEPSSPVFDRPLAAKSITKWCADLNPYGDERNLSAPMRDDGTGADLVAGDGVYSLPASFNNQGFHYWRVVACEYPSIAYPDDPAWVLVSEPNQDLALTFDTNRDDGGQTGFLPVSYTLNASDKLPALFVYGSLNNWQTNDEQTRLEKLDRDRYQLVYRIPKRGQHLATVAFESDGKIYGFMSDGRSNSWNMLKFETERENETVVFELNARTGRSAIFSGVPFALSWLAYDNGSDILLPILAGASLLFVIFALKRHEMIRRPDLSAKTGCPQCQSTELVRMPRSAAMRLLRLTGLDTGYYVCRQCTWKGIRLVGGNTVDVLGPRRPGSNLAQLAVMLLILGFSITLALQVRSSLNGTPILPTTINSAYQRVSQLAKEFNPQSPDATRSESELEDATQPTSGQMEIADSQDESQGLTTKTESIATSFNNWIRGVVLNAIDLGNNDPKMPVEESTETENSGLGSQFTPVQYEN
jgi:hypothetical protein